MQVIPAMCVLTGMNANMILVVGGTSECFATAFIVAGIWSLSRMSSDMNLANVGCSERTATVFVRTLKRLLT